MNLPGKRTKNRKYHFYLEDMLDAMQKIRSWIDGKTFEDFKNDELLADGVIRNLEVMGEAAKQIPHRVQNKYPVIPWKRLHMLRNFLAHEYFGIDLQIVWRIARDQLPELQPEMERIVRREAFT